MVLNMGWIGASPEQGIDEAVRKKLEELIAHSFRDLLEHKHLYQNFTFQNEIEAALEELLKVRPITEAENTKLHYRRLIDGRWEFDPNPRPVSDSTIPEKYTFRPLLLSNIPSVKIFCQNSTCNRIEAFNLVYATDLLKDSGWHDAGDIIQVFAFAYRCQSCKNIPEFFLIRRQGLKLIVNGRSPIEKMNTPPYTPHWVDKYYSSALVAYHSGQTLAALFFLRTLIEQFVRGPNKAKGEPAELISKYMATLPQDFNSRFPSLREVYEELSIAIHTGDESAELFDKSVKRIDKHFDARRLYELPHWKS